MRRRGRECALQILYQMDVGGLLGDEQSSTEGTDSAISRYWESFDEKQPVDREFAERLVRGVAGDRQALDEAIAAVSKHWKIHRMSAVDRNLIRLAAYEILRCPDIPKAASINEALEIAKRFSSGDASAFINGILDKLDA